MHKKQKLFVLCIVYCKNAIIVLFVYVKHNQKRGSCRVQIRVYYEDTDMGGVVYHSNYLNFCERARSEAFFSRGMNPVFKDGHFVARKLTADFYKSAKLGDLLEVKTELLAMKAASFSLKQEIYRDNELLFTLEILLVYIDFDAKVQRLDTPKKELILSLFS
jgi:acyl-CoA thioester hydrolase